MPRMLSSSLILLLLGAALAGCAPQSAAPPPAAPSPAAPPAQAAPAPAPAPTPDPGPAPAPAPAPAALPVGSALPPLPAGPCTPGATAMDLPAAPSGGITLKPPPTPGTAERPWLGYLSLDQLNSGTVYMRRGGTATVGTGELWLRGWLQPAPPAGWYDTHLLLEGTTPLDRQYTSYGEGRFDLRLPAGQAGDAFRLTLTDVLLGDGTSGDVTVSFCRQIPPGVTATYKDKDGWRPLGTQVPAAAPLTLRLNFSSDMLPESVERSLAGPHDKEGRSDGDWISGMQWIDPRTLEVVADPPGPVLKLNLKGAQDRYGLFLSGGLPAIYTGDPPQVLAVDPVSGQAARLADLSPEPRWADLSPDGQRLRLTAQQFVPGEGGPRWQHRLVDLTTGKSEEITPQSSIGIWLPSGELVSVTREGEGAIAIRRQSATGPQSTVISDLPAYDSYYLSPDGQWLVVLVHSGAQLEYPSVGVRFLIVSSDGKTRRTLAGDASMWRPGKDGIVLYGPAWSPDSSKIALIQPSGAGQALVIADLAAGALRTLTASLPDSRGSFDPVLWSPDGSKIVAGQSLIDAASGRIEGRIEGIRQMPFWSPDGRWLLLQTGEWGEITAYHLGTGKGTALGKGMALGWSPAGRALLIRWPAAPYRTIWGL